jgi:coenzyme A diphosphatase NUDT7
VASTWQEYRPSPKQLKMVADLARLRALPPPSHCDPRAACPPTVLHDVYARGQFGLDAIATPPRHASVLVPLFVDAASGELMVWLTLRTRRLKRHSGEVALPGGKRDEEDGGDRSTALREAEEEIGLVATDLLEVLCELERPVAVGGLLTGVVVASVSPTFSPAPNPSEVEAVFSMPLRAFVDGGETYAYRCEDLPPSGPGRPMRMHYFTQRTADGASYLVWGLTSSILIHTAEIVFGTSTKFEKDGPWMDPTARL